MIEMDCGGPEAASVYTRLNRVWIDCLSTGTGRSIANRKRCLINASEQEGLRRKPVLAFVIGFGAGSVSIHYASAQKALAMTGSIKQIGSTVTEMQKKSASCKKTWRR